MQTRRTPPGELGLTAYGSNSGRQVVTANRAAPVWGVPCSRHRTAAAREPPSDSAQVDAELSSNEAGTVPRMVRGGGGAGDDLVVAGGTAAVGTVAVLGTSGSSNAAPTLAFVGALLVALLTAYTAQRRQRTQLDAEANRLAQQLDHERQLQDLSDLREIMEDALDMADSARLAIAYARIATAAGDADEAEEQLAALRKEMRRMLNITNQLQIRLADRDPLLVAYRAMTEAIRDRHAAAAADDETAGARADAIYNLAYRTFVLAAKRRTGSRLPVLANHAASTGRRGRSSAETRTVEHQR